MQGPKVSICIPAYKQVLYLKKTLDSIARQIFTDFEIILTDDSPDNAVEKLVAEYNFNGKLHYHRNNPPLGTPENWNEAMRRSTGEYIKIMHHDDWFESVDSLKLFVLMLDENTNADLAFCTTKILNVKTNEFTYNKPIEKRIEAVRRNPDELFYGNSIGAPSATIFRKSVDLFFDKRMKYVVDIDFYIRILNRNKNLVFNTMPLIVNISNWEGQVTHHSMNKETQLTEYTLLYTKIKRGIFPSVKQLEVFRNLFITYNLRTITEFKELRSAPPKPMFIFKLLILYLKIKGRYKTTE